MSAWDLSGLGLELDKANKGLGLDRSVRVLSCYGAGREGFSLARYLEASGIENLIVDAGSLEVKRRWRRAKTDRLDLATLMNRLMRWHQGERGVWSVVQVPSVEAEDQRRGHRELEALKKERTRHVDRIKGLLASQGGADEDRRGLPRPPGSAAAVGRLAAASGPARSARARVGAQDPG